MHKITHHFHCWTEFVSNDLKILNTGIHTQNHTQPTAFACDVYISYSTPAGTPRPDPRESNSCLACPSPLPLAVARAHSLGGSSRLLTGSNISSKQHFIFHLRLRVSGRCVYILVLFCLRCCVSFKMVVLLIC